MAENFFKEIELSHQKPYGGVLFPTVLISNPDNGHLPPKLSVLTEAIKAHTSWLESLLHKSGAVLFRGFPVASPSDFNEVVEAFGFPQMPYVGGYSARSNVHGRVFTANDSRPDQKILFHHEMAYAREFPSKLFFFCEVEPGSGGETPILLSHVIYDRMKEKHPEFVEHLEEHGLIYTKILGEVDDPSSLAGRSWKSSFMTEDKSVAEERAAKQGMKLEWMEDSVKLVIGPVPGVKFDEARQRKTWFNGIAIYGGSKNMLDDADRGKMAAMFGDGKQLPAHIVSDCLEIMDKGCVAVPWQKGDVLLLDNLAVLHSRQPLITPPRRILASLCK